MQDSIALFASYTVKSACAGSMRNVVFSSPTGGEVLKIKGTLRLIGGNRMVQLEESRTEGRVSQRNLTPEQLEDEIDLLFPEKFSRVDLNDENGSASLMASKKGKITAVIPGALKNSLNNAASADMAAALVGWTEKDLIYKE